MEKFSYVLIPSPIGYVYIITTKRGICKLFIKDNTQIDIHYKRIEKPELVADFTNYFLGKRVSFSYPLDLYRITDFQKSVLKEVIKIPYGETRSYKAIAVNIGKKNASRAVGGTLARNPIPIIIPCHRVIKTNGNLGGYLYGSDIKRYLLELERGNHYPGICINHR